MFRIFSGLLVFLWVLVVSEERVIGSLGDLAAVPGMPSEPTLRKLIKDNPDFPVVSQGTNGVAYEIDIELAVRWIQGRQEAERDAARANAAKVKQFALELLGSDAAAQESDVGLSASERTALLQEELIAIKVAERRGQLIRKESVAEGIGALLVMHRERGRSFAARLAKRIDLPREVMVAIDALMEADQKELADRMERITEQADVTSETGSDTAL